MKLHRCPILCTCILILGVTSAFAQTQPPPAAPAPNVTQLSLQQIQKLIASSHFDEALQKLNVLAAQNPEPAGVERLRGMAYYQQMNLPSAEAAFAKAMALDPGDREAILMRGVSLFRMGKPAAAIPLLEQSHTSIASTNVDANYVLGLCYLDTRRYDDARHAFAAEYGFPPDSPPAYLLAARLMLRREYLPIAEQSAERALALDPTLPLAHQLLGEIRLAQSRFPEAIAEFKKERALNPLNAALYDRLGDAYIRTGDYASAQKALDRAVLLEPTSTDPFILLGKVLLRQHSPAMAIMYLQRAMRMDPKNYITHTLLGQAYRAVGRTQEASREFKISEQIQAASAPKLQNPR